MIKAIIFDLCGVLFTNGTKKFIKNLSAKYNLNPEKVRDMVDGEIGSQYREAKITRDEFWKTAREKLNITESADELESAWINGYELIKGTKDIILELAKKHRVYYLSDNVRERIEKLNSKYKFLDLFEDGIFSHEVGVRKPNPEIYKLALKKAMVNPNEAVFIDDKSHFLEPARQIGITTFLFTSPEELRKNLLDNKILEN